MAFAAFWGLHGAPQGFDGFPVFPGSTEDEFARDLLPVWYRQFGADLCITLMDVFALDGNQMKGMNIAHWMPVDTERLSVLDAGTLSLSPGRPIAMSRHGERALSEAGLNPLYAPHALDMQDVWVPPDDRESQRKQMGIAGKFVIGINAANQDPERKAFGEQLEAFARFAGGKDDVIMAIHSRAVTRMGPDLNRLIAYYGLGDKVHLAPQDMYAGGMISEPMMASWHGSIDVLSNCSYGEGFGLAILQSQATGTPVVVTHCSSMIELCGCGWLVPGQHKWNRGHQSNWQIPYIDSIVNAYEDAYARRGDEGMRKQAREFALQYDTERVYAEHWAPILEQLSGPRFIQSAGLKWRVDNMDDHGDRLGPQHEETVEDAILGLLPDGGVLLDVGAHVGHYTLRAAGRARKVIAVECNPATAARLRDNLALNQITNVTVHQLAAWDRIERLRLDAAHERDGSAKVTADGGGTVTGIPLDRVLGSEDRIDLVKLDVEGADLHALRGMAKTLQRLQPVMVIEDHSVYGDYDKADLEALLKELGYDLADLGMYGCAPYLVSRPVAVTQ